jgi:hypothetical protein
MESRMRVSLSGENYLRRRVKTIMFVYFVGMA